eukprot:c23876_g1_i1 orf=261-605(+)
MSCSIGGQHSDGKQSFFQASELRLPISISYVFPLPFLIRNGCFPVSSRPLFLVSFLDSGDYGARWTGPYFMRDEKPPGTVLLNNLNGTMCYLPLGEGKCAFNVFRAFFWGIPEC